MQAAFEVRKDHGDCLDVALVGEVLHPFLLQRVHGGAFLALVLRHQVQVFQLLVGKLKEIAQFTRHKGSFAMGDSCSRD